jgi:hypothetical protein
MHIKKGRKKTVIKLKVAIFRGKGQCLESASGFNLVSGSGSRQVKLVSKLSSRYSLGNP